MLYIKCIWCDGFSEIYAQLEEGVALCYIWNLYDEMVFQRSMLNWKRGLGQSAMGVCECAIYETYLV